MSVKRLLLTLLAFPIFGILLVSSLGLINTLDQLQQAKFAQASVEVAVPVGDLIHELQVERGLSAGFIASKGANFSDQLPRHRLRVNEVVETARKQLEEKRGIYPDEVVKLEKAVQAALLLRSQVDGLTISAPNMAASYTAAINSAIHLNETMLAHFTDGGLARSGTAWIAITEAKEAAGLERAMGATGFGAGEFSPPVLNNFISFQSVQLASIKIFKQYADAAGIEADPLQQAENTALFEFRDIAKSGDVNQIQRVAVGDWFSRSTEWVERLRVFENQIAIAVVSHSKASTAKVGFNVSVYVGAALLAVLASAFGFWLIARRLLRGFGNLQQAMASLAKKDFEAEIASKSKVLEVDGLATSLTSMRDELALADSKLVAAFSKSFAFDDSNSAMMIVGPDLKLISLNTEARKLLSNNADDFESRIHGLNAHDAIDCSLAGLLGSENQMMDKFSNKALLPWTGDVAIGALKLEVNVSYVESENGEFAGNVIEARDVTLARLHAGMIASIDQNTCVMEFSLAGEVLGANANTEILVGANAQDLTGKLLYDLLHKDYDDLGALKEKWSKLAAGEGFTAELRLHHFGSGEAWLRANFTPVKDGQGDVFKISVIAEDTTIAVLADQTRKAEKAKQDSEREVVVTNLANGLKALARGNLGYRIETPFSAEFKSLRMDFNDAISEMSGAILEVSESATKLKLNSQELSGSSVDLAVRTEKQAKNLSEAATALDQLAATAKQTVIRAKEADGVVDQVMTDASQKEGIVKEAIGVMELISKSSQEIEAFSAMIDDISFQTNLLALNAGVEAARAGEAGRGFAVVASEVRALAQRSAEAASEINALLNTSSEKVQKGVSLVNSVGTGLIEISHQIRTIHDQVSGIRNATSDQAKVLGVVNASVSEIEGITQMNAAMGEESSALSTTLERDAEQLFLSVSKFAAEENRTQDAA